MVIPASAIPGRPGNMPTSWTSARRLAASGLALCHVGAEKMTESAGLTTGAATTGGADAATGFCGSAMMDPPARCVCRPADGHRSVDVRPNGMLEVYSYTGRTLSE